MDDILDIHKGIANVLAARFGLSRSPVYSLEEDDDWAFVIKMHGYLEATLNNLLLDHFDNPKMEKTVRHLETNNDRRGKLAFIMAYDLLPTNATLFISMLSILRSDAVHDLGNIEINLVRDLCKNPRTNREKWITALTWWWGQYIIDFKPEAVLSNPRNAIFSSVVEVMAKTFARRLNLQVSPELLRLIASHRKSNSKE